MPDKYMLHTVDQSGWTIQHHRRLGYSRLYVVEDGTPLGWCDLESGVLVAVESAQHDALMRFVSDWLHSEAAAYLGEVPAPHDPDHRTIVQPRRRATGVTTADVLLDVEERSLDPGPDPEPTPAARRLRALRPRLRPTGEDPESLAGRRRRLMQRLRFFKLPRLGRRRRRSLD